MASLLPLRSFPLLFRGLELVTTDRSPWSLGCSYNQSEIVIAQARNHLYIGFLADTPSGIDASSWLRTYNVTAGDLAPSGDVSERVTV